MGLRACFRPLFYAWRWVDKRYNGIHSVCGEKR